MKWISLFFTIFAIYLTWQISRINLGYAIICASASFVTVCWLLDPRCAPKKKPKCSHKQVNQAAREMNDLMDKK